jgi:hypothetical protein
MRVGVYRVDQSLDRSRFRSAIRIQEDEYLAARPPSTLVARSAESYILGQGDNRGARPNPPYQCRSIVARCVVHDHQFKRRRERRDHLANDVTRVV